jgi:hypothetical protein
LTSNVTKDNAVKSGNYRIFGIVIRTELNFWLFEVEVLSGELESPSGRSFPILSEIPDMCAHLRAGPQEDEGEDALE